MRPHFPETDPEISESPTNPRNLEQTLSKIERKKPLIIVELINEARFQRNEGASRVLISHTFGGLICVQSRPKDEMREGSRVAPLVAACTAYRANSPGWLFQLLLKRGGTLEATDGKYCML